MKAIILCAGYAMRLLPLTENKPKALLEVKGKPILDHIVEKLEEVDSVDEIYVVGNSKFFNNFLEWKNSRDFSKKIFILDDGSTGNDNRVGGIGGLLFAIDSKNIEDDFMVVLGDNYFNFDLNSIVGFFYEKKAFSVGLFGLDNLEDVKHFGVVEVKEDEIVGFEEKPSEPKSKLISTGIYVFAKNEIGEIKNYVKGAGSGRGGPGYLIPYLLKKQKIYGLEMNGFWYDIGTLETYEKVK